MALNNKKTSSRKPQGTQQDKPEVWVNVYVHCADGKNRQLGGVPLNLENALHDLVFKAGEDKLDALAAAGRITFKINDLREEANPDKASWLD